MGLPVHTVIPTSLRQTFARYLFSIFEKIRACNGHNVDSQYLALHSEGIQPKNKR